MRRTGAVILGMLLLAAAAAAVLLATFDPNDHKALLERWASEALGNAVRIEGPIALTRSLTPTLVVNDLSIAGADERSAVSIGRAEVSVVLPSLLFGPLHLPHVAIDKAEVDLPLKLALPTGGGEVPRVDRLTLSSITVHYHRGDGNGLRAVVERATLVPDADHRAAAFALTGTVGALPLEASATLQGDGPSLKVHGLALTLGNSDLAGDLAWQSGGRGKLSGKLSANRIDLADLGLPGGGAEPPGDGVVPALPMLLPAQIPVDLDLEVAVGQLDLPPEAEIKGLAVTAAGSGRELDLTLAPSRLGAGSMRAHYKVEDDGQAADIALEIDAKGLDLADVFGDPGGGNKLPKEVTIAIDLAGAGTDLHDFLGSATGPIAITSGPAVIAGRLANQLGKSLFTAIIPDWKPSHGAHIICSVLDLKAKDGKARTSALVIDGKHVVIGGGGAIDLASGKIDFMLLPTSKNATLAPLVAPVHLAGTITDPQVMGDAADILNSTGHLLLGIVNPLSLATPILHPDRSGKMPCLDPAAFAGGQRGPVERVGKDALDAIEGVGHGIGGAIEKLGKGASDLLHGVTGR